MITDVIPVLTNMFVQLFNVLDTIYTYLGAWSILLGAMIVYTLVRMLIIPLLGGNLSGGASDTVQKGALTKKTERLNKRASKGREE